MFKIFNDDCNIDWLSKDSHWLFDPSRKDASTLEAAARKAPFYPAHIGLFTSGFQKAVLISKEAVLIAAAAAVKHLNCESKKLWLIPLPFFHIAGLAAAARAFCGGFSCKQFKRPWRALDFTQELREKKASYTSLVPAQIYDLIAAKLAPPPSLELALAGGDALSTDLYQKAKALGWPLLPTYGMTEAASQIAAAERSSLTEAGPPRGKQTSQTPPPMRVLPHVQVRVDEESGLLSLKSPALLTGQLHLSSGRFEDPKDSDGWFQTADRGRLKSASADGGAGAVGGRRGKTPTELVIEGRADDQVKISGRSLSLNRLSEKLQTIAEKTFAETAADAGAAVADAGRKEETAEESAPASRRTVCLVAPPCQRKGRELVLAADFFDFKTLAEIVRRFNQDVSRAERIKSVCAVKEIPRKALFKIDRESLKKQLY